MKRILAASALIAAGLVSTVALAAEGQADPVAPSKEPAQPKEPALQPKEPATQLQAPNPGAQPAPAPVAPPAANALSAADRRFIDDAALGNMEEIKLGQLAKDHAQSDDVKKFAQRMIDDHTKVNDELKSLAEKKGVDLPKELPRTEQSNETRLSKLSGPQFDKQYVTQMLLDHKKDVGEFARQAANAKDPDVKQFAQKTLPALQEHEKLVTTLARETAKEGVQSEPGTPAQPNITPPNAPKITPPTAPKITPPAGHEDPGMPH